MYGSIHFRFDIEGGQDIGTITDVFHTNFRNAVGVGLLSGDTYRATSAEARLSRESRRVPRADRGAPRMRVPSTWWRYPAIRVCCGTSSSW